MDPFFHTGLSISDSLKTVRKSVLIYETIIVLIVFSAIVLILLRKYIKSFWSKNIWSRQFLLIFIAFNVLASSIGSVIGYKWDDILLVNVENVSNVTKLILIIFYIVIFKNTELPNSFFIRFASKNEALLNRKN